MGSKGQRGRGKARVCHGRATKTQPVGGCKIRLNLLELSSLREKTDIVIKKWVVLNHFVH